MTTEDVAAQYFEWANENNWEQIREKLYSEQAVSVEKDPNGNWTEVQGMQALKQKAEQWSQGIEEVHSGYTNKPIVAGTHFSCTMGMDITMKGSGRMKLDEVCVFEVQNGKIVKEQFFY